MAEPHDRKDAAEAAAIRRRWITLGEVLAVAAVVISGLTFWNGYSERQATESERAADKQVRAAEEQEEAIRAQTLLLRASGGGNRLTLTAADASQTIQGQGIVFPSTLGAGAIDTLEPRIEAAWIEDAIERARSDADGRGDARLPLAITTRFVSDGESYSDTAIYDVGYALDRGLIDTDVGLLGISLVERVAPGKAGARLDSIWRARRPAARGD